MLFKPMVSRYICLCVNHWYRRVYTLKRCVMMAIALWVVCALLEMPNYFNWGGHAFDAKTMACSYDRTANYSYTLFFVLVTIAPPLVTVLVCYLKVFLHVRKSRKEIQKIGGNISGGNSSGQKSLTSSEVQLAKTLFIIYVVFLICWAPYAVVVLIDIQDEWSKVAYVVAIQLAHTNSSVNSIIYAASNKDFRTGYQMVLRKCCCPCWKRSTDGATTNAAGGSSTVSNASTVSIIDVKINMNGKKK